MAVAVLALGVLAAVPVAASPPHVAAHTAAKGASHGSPQRAVKALLTTNGAWTQYHHDDAHTGFDSTAPAVTSIAAAWVSPTLDEAVFGEPLVYQGLVYVATLNNSVYALNQSDGTVVWGVNLGAPETSGWQCGNINPTGILGTGVIDPSNSRIYEVAFLHQYHAYFLFGLNLNNGNLVLLTEVSPNGFDWTIQQQRGALSMSHDNTHVYIPFGGRAGDCGAYHGWVAGVPTSGAAPDELYETPSTGSGIWAAGGIVVDDATSNVFFATGNAIPCGGAVNSDSVIKTNAALGPVDFFQPQDWSNHWCGPDLDLGSAGPVLISPNLMFSAGKYGQGFLVNPKALGGTNGQLFPAQAPYVGADVCRGNHNDATFGSFAYAAPYVYVTCRGNGMVGMQVNTSTPSFSLCDATCASPSWNSGGSTTFGPPIVAAGAVWAVDINGSGLHGFDAATGAQIYQSGSFGVAQFSTPSEAGGEIFVSANTEVRAFVMNKCATAALSPTSQTQPAGAIVTLTASSTGCANPRYAFWVQDPSGRWSFQQDFGGPSFNWSTAGLAAGTYTVHVWVNKLGTGYDAIGSATVTLTGCGSASLSPPTTTQPVGATINFTASSSGCSSPRYAFWVQYPNGNWYFVRGFGGPTFNWNTTGLLSGTYTVHVWVNNQGNGYDAFGSATVTLTPCSSGSISPPTPSQSAGSTFNFTASSMGCLGPRYAFWVQYPGGAWYFLQGFGGPTFNWNTAGLAPGNYTIHAWVNTQGNGYDTFGSATATLTGCTASTISPASGSAPAGTTVMFTAGATGCPNPTFEFWLLDPGGTWHFMRGYSTTPAWSWNSTGWAKGTYTIHVWANQQGASLGTYETIGSATYTLT
jgi:hypothetical protein